MTSITKKICYFHLVRTAATETNISSITFQYGKYRRKLRIYIECFRPKDVKSTFWGASCSGTSQSSSEAAGSCMPSNCLRRPIATDSAEFDCSIDGELWRETLQQITNQFWTPFKTTRLHDHKKIAQTKRPLCDVLTWSRSRGRTCSWTHCAWCLHLATMRIKQFKCSPMRSTV